MYFSKKLQYYIITLFYFIISLFLFLFSNLMVKNQVQCFSFDLGHKIQLNFIIKLKNLIIIIFLKN